MAYLYAEQFTEDPIEVTLSPGARPGDEKVRIKLGNAVIRMDVAEAVDLVDGVIAALAQVEPTREIRRDETAVREQADVRESL
ncbi:hypothetical protein ACHIPZ_04935 [Antrihabitans sp. NCIMB 15449]|uniref:Uncharacterized protein n=1 Tax=Antrihabitans spumae TaxID=3373370 RepID=A0ABW7JIM0_9NOCA